MRRNVLVVDDQQYIRILLKDNLEFDEFTTLCASRGREALESLERFTPDLAIVDIGLPDISGWTVCKTLKQRYPDIELIVLSAMNADDVRAAMKPLGLKHFVPKPYDPIALSDLVKQLLDPGR